MRYLLYTNACIRYLNGRSLPLAQKLLALPVTSVFVCSIVKAELFFGAAKSQMIEQKLARQISFLNQFVSLPFDDASAQIFGRIRAELARRGTPIGAYDLQIAAIALVNNVTLVSHNTNEFARVAGLMLEDWET
ncbi:MAG: type II toxin-antitoxin system VapC family toxin [Chloroflexota bacterium]|nr:type II toxin-antitoxin system VapC family toxin [Chloroflexota bacterium]